MHDFLALARRNAIRIDVEPVALRDVNHAMQRLARGDVKGRFVIDFARGL
jgi:D-arabinose 1-dehydrogenase-like Zn-dependent alcohol dehydrogenase